MDRMAEQQQLSPEGRAPMELRDSSTTQARRQATTLYWYNIRRRIDCQMEQTLSRAGNQNWRLDHGSEHQDHT